MPASGSGFPFCCARSVRQDVFIAFRLDAPAKPFSSISRRFYCWLASFEGRTRSSCTVKRIGC